MQKTTETKILIWVKIEQSKPVVISAKFDKIDREFLEYLESRDNNKILENEI